MMDDTLVKILAVAVIVIIVLLSAGTFAMSQVHYRQAYNKCVVIEYEDGKKCNGINLHDYCRSKASVEKYND